MAELYRDRCPKVYGAEVRGKSYEIHEMEFKIDAHGRPAMASNVLNPSESTRFYQAVYNTRPPNNEAQKCRATIRGLGKLGDEAGHLVPKAKGGPDIRANLVPQNGNLNGGEWRDKFEKTMRNCVDAPGIWGYYKVEPIYAWGSSLRPTQLKVSMRTWSFSLSKIQYLEYYIHNDPADWHDRDAREKGKKWQETFSFCNG